MPLGRYLKVNIFEPLDMKNTGFDITPDQKENLSEQFTFHEDSKTSTLISQENKFKLSNNYESGGAGLVSRITSYNVCYTKLLRFQNYVTVFTRSSIVRSFLNSAVITAGSLVLELRNNFV